VFSVLSSSSQATTLSNQSQPRHRFTERLQLGIGQQPQTHFQRHALPFHEVTELVNQSSLVPIPKNDLPIYICVACNVPCRNKSSLSRHQKRHCEREVEWLCSLCVPKKSFYEKYKLAEHHINKHGKACVADCKQQRGGLCLYHLSLSAVENRPKKAWGCPCCLQCFDTLAAWTTHSASHRVQNDSVVGWSLITMVQSLLLQPCLQEAAARLPWEICDPAKVKADVYQDLRETLERHKLPDAVRGHYDYRHLQLPEALARYAFRLVAYGGPYQGDVATVATNINAVETATKQLHKGFQNQLTVPTVPKSSDSPVLGYWNPDDPFAYPQRAHLPIDAVSVRDNLNIPLLDDAATVATNTNADQNTRAAEASVACRDYVHNGEQQYNSNYITARELRDDIGEGCGAKNGDCARLEATYGLPADDQSSGGAEVYAIKKLKTTKAESPLITSLSAATAAVVPPRASLAIRPKLELNSSSPSLLPCDEDYAIAISELSGISDDLTKYFTYYCPIPKCVHSASPELSDLDSRNSKTIHNGENHKVYVLDGLSEADPKTHIFEAHNIAIRDSGHLFKLSTYKHTPLIAEKRRFTVAPATNPDATGWLIRTRIAGQAWSDWKGVDYDIIAASGFRSWDCKNCRHKLQPRPSNARTDTATDESIDCALKSNALVDVLHRETGGNLEGSAELPVNISAGEMRHTVDSVEAIASHGNFDSAKQPNSYNNAKSQSRPGSQPPAPMSLMSSEVGHGPGACTEGSTRSISDDRSLSPEETNSDEDIDSDVSITVRTKRRVLEDIMNEVRTVYFANFSGTLRCQSEASESTSSLKPSSSFEQTPQTQSSISAGKKRGQDHDPLSEDEDDNSQKRHKKSISASLMAARARLLACPFNKHEPKTYGPYNDDKAMARKFKRCGGPGWDDLPRLK
jgi:hypothetical protein